MAEPGKVLELPHLPISINVSIKRWQEATAEEMLSIEVDTVVIPLKTIGWETVQLEGGKD